MFVLPHLSATIVARDTSCGLLDLSGTRRSAWFKKPGKILNHFRWKVWILNFDIMTNLDESFKINVFVCLCHTNSPLFIG